MSLYGFAVIQNKTQNAGTVSPNQMKSDLTHVEKNKNINISQWLSVFVLELDIILFLSFNFKNFAIYFEENVCQINCN